MDVSQVLLLQTAVSSDRFLLFIEFITGDAKKDHETINEFWTNEKRRAKLLKWIWIVSVIFSMLLSGAALGLSIWLNGTLKPGIVIVVLIWAVLIGGTALVFLSHRILTATFGALLGVSLSEASKGAAGLVAKASSGIGELATQIGRMSGSDSASVGFIDSMLWLFIIVVACFCLPAFFGE